MNLQCFASNDSNVPVAASDSASNVSRHFEIIYELLFYGVCIDLLRELLAFCYYKYDVKQLVFFVKILSYVALVHLTNAVLIHIYRLNHAGRVCSGDYLTSDELNTP